MLILDARQEALLRLPNRFAFLPRLAAEIRRDLPEYVRGLDDRALLIEVQRCYDHASQSLGITRLPVLVQWTKTDVGSGGELHRNTEIDMAMRLADSPDTMAADLLAALVAQCRWQTGGL